MALDRVRRRGRYAPLSATYFQDDDIAEAGEAAELLFVRGLAYCASRDSDGFMSDSQITRFVGVGMTDALGRAEALVEVGLWNRVPGGYVVRSWLKWNKSADEMGHYLAEDRERKRRAAEEARAADAAPETVRAERDADSETLRSEHGADSARNPAGVGPEHLAEMPEKRSPGQEDASNSKIPRGIQPDGARILPPSTVQYSTEAVHNTLSPPPATSESEPDHPDFAEFWATYPRPVAIDAARKTFTALVKAGVDPHDILEGAKRYRDSSDLPKDIRYIPYPAKWLTTQRWKDGPATGGRHRANWWDN